MFLFSAINFAVSEKAMAAHSSTLAWKIPWTEEAGGLQPWGLEESDMTEQLHFHFSLWCIGEGNGNPLQCSCLENPRVGGAWWAAVHGVTWLRRPSSSSSKLWFCVINTSQLNSFCLFYHLLMLSAARKRKLDRSDNKQGVTFQTL